MARNTSFTKEDLLPKIPSKVIVQSSSKIGGILRVELKSIPEAQILAGFERAINRASARITVDLKQALDEALNSSVWASREGSSDIYDTGELLSSGKVTISSDGIKVAYSAPYAALVHYGGYINPYGNSSIKIYLPPRPWVQSVLEGGGPVPEFDFERYYREEVEREFSG